MMRTMEYFKMHSNKGTVVLNVLPECVNWFLIGLLKFSPNLNHMVSHGLGLPGLDLMACITEATRNWHIEH